MMAPVRLALYKPHRWSDFAGKLICFWTRSPYSHCEIALDGWCYSSSIMDGGVRRKKIDLTPPWWEIVDLPGVFPEQVLSCYRKTQGQPYGWLDLICNQILRLPVHDQPGEFCSSWCAAALDLHSDNLWTPGMLAQWAEKLNDNDSH